MYSIASGMSLIREVINAHRILEEKNSVRILQFLNAKVLTRPSFRRTKEYCCRVYAK
jgi:hypothetical protein